MMERFQQIIFLGFMLLLTACNGPKSLTKKGDKLQAAGVHHEAIKMYMKALDKKNSYAEAHVGLRNSGNAILSEMGSTFFQAANTGDHKTAVYAYRDMEAFVKKVGKYNLKLNIQPSYTDDYKSSRKTYVEARFKEANELINKENFKEAQAIFKEIKTIDKEFGGQDFDELNDIAKYEPHYRAGSKLLGAGQNRKAYYEFKKIVDRNSNYKDAKFKFDEAKENAQYTIGMMAFKNLSRDRSTAEYISTEITNYVLESRNPFVKLIDRAHFNGILREQKLNLEGLTDGKVAIEAGKLSGAKAFLVGTVLKVKKRHSPITSTQKKAYQAVRIKKYDSVAKKSYYEKVYKKVQYNEYSGKNSVLISFKYQLISTETGTILSSEIIEKELVSRVNYADYEGDYESLIPGYWKYAASNSPEDVMENNKKARRKLRDKFTAKKELKSKSTLLKECQVYIGETTAKNILAFNPEERR